MVTPRQPKHAFTPQDLEALDLALIGALATIRELGIRRSGLQTALRRRLFDLASEGVAGPEALQNALVKSMNLDKVAR